MAVYLLSAVVSRTVPSTYYLPTFLAILFVVIVRAFSQGRRTNRDRDLHARTVVLTGAFTPLGLTLLEFLAKRGAHVIALVPSLTPRHVEILSLLRDAAANEAIYAEPCPLDSPAGIQKFCERFVNAENENDRRIDALILAHEYGHIGTMGAGFENVAALREGENMMRDESAMATFLLTTLLLPALLIAPVERDIRIISIANPFYAAASPEFDPTLCSSKYGAPQGSATASRRSRNLSTWSLEGQRALRSAVFMRHLQRILDALPEPGQPLHGASSPQNTPSDLGTSSSLKRNAQPSNILAVTVSPGICRTDTVAPYFFPPPTNNPPSITRQLGAALLYICLQPFLRIFTKTPTSALQSVQHVLCVPTSSRRRRAPQVEDPAQPPTQTESLAGSPVKSPPKQAEEVLVAGALYADCAIVRPHPRVISGANEIGGSEGAEKFDLGLGDEPLGRAVWEALEEGVKIWRSQEKTSQKDGDSIKQKETAKG